MKEIKAAALEMAAAFEVTRMNDFLKIMELSAEQNIYSLVDERGRSIGTGSLEVCEVLLYLVGKADNAQPAKPRHVRVPGKTNIRSAISI